MNMSKLNSLGLDLGLYLLIAQHPNLCLTAYKFRNYRE